MNESLEKKFAKKVVEDCSPEDLDRYNGRLFREQVTAIVRDRLPGLSIKVVLKEIELLIKVKLDQKKNFEPILTKDGQ